MAKGAPEAPQGGGENALDFLWLVVLILAAVALIWYFGKIYIAEAVFIIRWGEIIAVKAVLGYSSEILQPFNISFLKYLQPLDAWLTFMHRNYGADLEFTTLVNLSTAVGHYIRYPIVVILLLCSGWLYFGSAAQRFRIAFDVKRLRAVERKNWPYINPVSDIDLVTRPLDQAPWAPALNPMKFCKQFNLLQETVKNDKPAVTLKKGAANRVLALQLGARWRSLEVLPEHLQALFAIFAARADGGKESADRLLTQISVSAIAGATKLNFGGAQSLMHKHQEAKAIKRVMNLHGYVTGVMASMLNLAREAGVLASAEFLWLKTIDRPMWYMLNSVGRPTAVAEISGAFAHWLAERKLGLPLMVPMVDEAVRGLEVALNEIIYKPDEE